MQQKVLLIAGALIGTLLVVIGFFFLRPELQEQILPPAQHEVPQASSEALPTNGPENSQQTNDKATRDVTRIVIHHKNGATDEDIDSILSEKVIINDEVVDSPEPEQ